MAERPINEKEVAELLNDLGTYGMENISDKDSLREIVIDYFTERGEEDEGSDEEEKEEAEIEQLLEARPRETPISSTLRAGPSTEAGTSGIGGGYFQSESEAGDEDDGSAIEGYAPIRHLADEIFPQTDDQPHAQPEPLPACNCKLNDGQPCHTRFSPEDLINVRLQCLEMTRQELDICILSKLACFMSTSTFTRRSKHKQKERTVQKTEYRHHDYRICRDVFKYLHAIGQDKLNSLITHYKACGVEARVHKLARRRPHNALQYCETRMVVDFIVNYAEVHAICLPGRTPHHWKDNVKLLPSHCTKKSVYLQYATVADAANVRVVAYRTFRRIWQEALPFIAVMKPATDLCWICQQGTYRYVSLRNSGNGSKEKFFQEMVDHIQQTTKERSLYNVVCKEAKNALSDGAQLGKNPACSYGEKSHYSFDFAQQVQYPSDPLQPGPIFFKSPRKCALFGVCCEALSSQVNFLIDEAVDVGKGANCVVSMLHYFYENFGLGETEVHLHADNCSGQNKNSTMMMYHMWRVLTGRHHKVTQSFLITGHTKFSCDWCFGLVKRRFRRTPVNCLADLVKVVNDSAKGNIAQLCGNEKGDVFVPVYDWTTFLGNFFRKVKNIKKYHHFSFNQSSGILELKQFSDSRVEYQDLLIKLPPLDAMPELIAPIGIGLKRQWYLYDEIREFVLADDAVKDLVAPKPSAPKPKSQAKSTEHGDGADDYDDDDAAGDMGPSLGKKSKPSGGGTGRGRGRGRGRGQERGRGKGRGKKSA